MKLEISIPTRDFIYLCIIISLAFICIFVYKEGNTIFVVNTYKNCTCPESFNYYKDLTNQFVKNNDKGICPIDTKYQSVPCDCHKDGCLTECFECVEIK